MKLLIVDDEVQIREGLSEGIEWAALGFDEVLIAENGVEAFALFQAHRPEIIITDIRMPGMDGLELSKRVREMSDFVKIIILSGHSDFTYAKEAIQIRVNDFELKPVKISNLLALVARLMKEYEAERLKARNQQEAAVISYLEAAMRGEKTGPAEFTHFYVTRDKQLKLCIQNVEIDQAKAIIEAEFQMHAPALDGEMLPQAHSLCLDLMTILIRTLDERNVEIGGLMDGSALARIGELTRLSEYREWIVELYSLVLGRLAPNGTMLQSPVIRNATAYIKDHYSEDLSVDGLARKFGLTPNYFSHLFKKEVGVRFSEYINKCRIEEAKRLLKEPHLMAYEVTGLVGFQDYKYFFKVFKKMEGCSPSDYRKSIVFKES